MRYSYVRPALSIAIVAALMGGATLWNRHLNAPAIVKAPPAPPAAPPRPNGYDDFRRAAVAVEEPPYDVWTPTPGVAVEEPPYDVWPPTPGAPPKHYTPEQIQAFVARNANALASLRAGLERDCAVPATGADYFYTGKFRCLARALAFNATAGEKRGDYAGGAAFRLEGIRFGIDIGRGGATIDSLVGMACEATSRRGLWADLPSLDAKAAGIAARQLAAAEQQRISLAPLLTAEKWSEERQFADMLNRSSVSRVYQDLYASVQQQDHVVNASDFISHGPDPADHSGGPSNAEIREGYRILLTFSKQDIVNEVGRLFDGAISRAATPFSELPENDPGTQNPIVALVVPSVRNLAFKRDSARMENGLLELALALRAYRLLHGSYPESLQPLVADGLLPAVPVDPFAVRADAPFRYQKQPGDTFVLYSVGPDGIDNGGTPVQANLLGGGKTRRAYCDEADRGDWVYGVNTPTR